MDKRNFRARAEKLAVKRREKPQLPHRSLDQENLKWVEDGTLGAPLSIAKLRRMERLGIEHPNDDSRRRKTKSNNASTEKKVNDE